MLSGRSTYAGRCPNDPHANAAPILNFWIHEMYLMRMSAMQFMKKLIYGSRLRNDRVTSPSRKPNLLITARFSITLSSIMNIQSSKLTW